MQASSCKEKCNYHDEWRADVGTDPIISKDRKVDEENFKEKNYVDTF